MRLFSTAQKNGMMIANYYYAYLNATIKRAAWVLGFRGIPLDFSNKITVNKAVYLCNIYTGKTNAIFSAANSLKQFYHCHSRPRLSRGGIHFMI